MVLAAAWACRPRLRKKVSKDSPGSMRAFWQQAIILRCNLSIESSVLAQAGHLEQFESKMGRMFIIITFDMLPLFKW